MGLPKRSSEYMIRITLATILLLGVMFMAVGCNKAEDALEQRQQEEVEKFEEDIENSAGRPGDSARDAVEETNEIIDAAEAAEEALGGD